MRASGRGGKLRKRKAEARKILRDALAKQGCDTSYDPAIMDIPRGEAVSEQWWTTASSAGESVDTRYTQARLSAYLAIATSEPLFARGIRLDRGRVWMDRSVIARLLKANMLEFRSDGQYPEPYFHLTPAGEEFVK